MKRGKKPNIEIRKQIRKMKSEGMTYSEIGKHFGFTRQAAQQKLCDNTRGPGRGCCESCGNECDQLHRHHTNYLTNDTVHLCRKCHSSHNSDTFEYRRSVISKRALSKLREEISNLNHLSPQLANKLSGVPLKFCREHLGSIVSHVLNTNQKYPWHFVNWEIPTFELSKIWPMSYQSIASFRYRFAKIKPLWNSRFSNGNNYSNLIQSEKEKAAKWNQSIS